MPLQTRQRALLALGIGTLLLACSSQSVFAGPASQAELEIKKLQQQLEDMLEGDTFPGKDPVSRLLQELLHSTKELLCESWNAAVRLRLDDLQTSIADPRLAQTLEELEQAIQQACAPLTYQAHHSLPDPKRRAGENQSPTQLASPETVPAVPWTLFDEVCVRKGYSQKQAAGQMGASALSEAPEKAAATGASFAAEDAVDKSPLTQRQALIRDDLEKKLRQAGYDASMSLSDFNLIQRIYWRALSPEGLSERDVSWLHELVQKNSHFFEQLPRVGYIAEFKLRPVQSGGFISQIGFIPVLDAIAAEELKRAYETRLSAMGSSVAAGSVASSGATGEKAGANENHAAYSSALRDEAEIQTQPLTAPAAAFAASPTQDRGPAPYDYTLPWAQDSREMVWVNEIFPAQELSEFKKNAGDALRLGIPKDEIDGILALQQEAWIKTPQLERQPASAARETVKFQLGAKIFGKLHPQAIVIENADETEVIVAAVTKARLEEGGTPQKWTPQEMTKLQELSRNRPIGEVWYKATPGTKGFQPGFYRLVENGDVSAIEKAAQRPVQGTSP